MHSPSTEPIRSSTPMPERPEPLIASRKPKSRKPVIQFQFHPSMLPLVERIKSKSFQTPEPSKHEIVRPEPVRPRKREHRNTRCAAVLCTNSAGMTITNGVRTISIDNPSNGEMARELAEFRVRYLTLVDEKTEKRWMDVAKSGLVKNVKATRCKTFQMKDCEQCKSDDCHVWRAAAVMKRVYHFPFNPIH